MTAAPKHEMDAELDVLEDIVARAETLAELTSARAEVVALKAANQNEIIALNAQLQTTGTMAWYRGTTSARARLVRQGTRLAGLLSKLRAKLLAFDVHGDETDLVERAVLAAGHNQKVAGPRWAAVMRVFAVGITRAQDLCCRFGLDPDEIVGRGVAS